MTRRRFPCENVLNEASAVAPTPTGVQFASDNGDLNVKVAEARPKPGESRKT